MYIIGIVILRSCAAGLDPRNPSDVAARTEVQSDPHDAITRDKGPTVDSFEDRTSYFPRAWSSSDGVRTAQLEVRANFSDWAFLDSAYSEGQSVDVTKIDSTVSCGRYGCSHYEHISVNLSIDTLRNLASKDIVSIKIAGRRGSRVIDIPGQYIKGFLAAIDTRAVAGLQ